MSEQDILDKARLVMKEIFGDEAHPSRKSEIVKDLIQEVERLLKQNDVVAKAGEEAVRGCVKQIDSLTKERDREKTLGAKNAEIAVQMTRENAELKKKVEELEDSVDEHAQNWLKEHGYL